LQPCIVFVCYFCRNVKIVLIRSVFIIRFLSGLLLMVFAVSITPKRFLHNAFAKHVDDRCKKTSDHRCQVSISGYNCDNDNQVAESAFVTVHPSFSFPLFFSFSSYIAKEISFSSTTGIYSPLRGPPVEI
jgi:hypothetical protein